MQTLDKTDQKILSGIITSRDAVQGIRLGDFVKMPSVTLERLSLDRYGDSIQTTDGRFGASFRLFNGGASFAGGHNDPIDKKRLTQVDEVQDGSFWIFHHNQVKAHNSVHFKMPCRVYECLGE